MEKFSLEALREFLCENERGQIFDSFLAVEIGLEDYAVSWEAHQDFLEDEVPEAMGDLGACTLGYLLGMAMDLQMEETDIDKLLASVNET